MCPGAVLATYSTSLTARARLAAAGRRVGAAPHACGKTGTLASQGLALPPLDPPTARRVARRALEQLRAHA